MTNLAELGDFYRNYGESSFAEDEPVYATICHGIADRPELLELLAGHVEEARQPNLIFAAVRYLLLGGLEHELAAVFAGTSQADPSEAFADLVLSHRAEIDELLLTRRTQTNEVGRSAMLSLMLHHAEAQAGGPLAWIDLGASGGLNLLLDHFRINYDVAGSSASTGPPESNVVLRSEVRAGSPSIPAGSADIGWRIGIDQAPIDVTEPAEARWLQACLWPSKVERLGRMAEAIKIAKSNPPRVLHADAVDGLAQALREVPADHTIVVTTTWVWFYLPADVRALVLELLRAHDERVFWYSCEGAGVVSELNEAPGRDYTESTLGVVELGAGQPDRAELLGLAHPHGAWFTWQPS